MTQHEARREVQPGFRFIQNQHVRIVQERRHEQDLLPHALGVPTDGLIGGPDQPEQIQERHDLPGAKRTGKAAQTSDQFELLTSRQERVEVRFLGDITDPGLVIGKVVRDVAAVEEDLTGRGFTKPGHERHRRGLAGPIRSKQTEDRARLQRQADVPNRRNRRIVLGEAPCLESRLHSRQFSSKR